MTPEEFAAARQLLGWRTVDAAVLFNVTPPVVEGWEEGALKIPSRVAQQVRWQAALVERQRVIQESGLPSCTEVAALRAKAEQAPNDEARSATINSLVEHAKVCAICIERAEYIDSRCGPLPDYPMSGFVRFFSWALELWNRLPPAIRPPDGERGRGRRAGLLSGLALSLFALATCLLFSLSSLVRDGWRAEVWRETFTGIPVLILAYFIGFFVAGCVYDALRPIRRWLIGYILRWGLGGAIVYGTIGISLPLIDHESHWSWGEIASITGILGVVWSFVGAGLWAKDKIKGKGPVAEP